MNIERMMKSNKEERTWLTLQEAAAELDIPYETLLWRVRNGKIEAMRIPQSRRYAIAKSVIAAIKSDEVEFLKSMEDPPIDRQ